MADKTAEPDQDSELWLEMGMAPETAIAVTTELHQTEERDEGRWSVTPDQAAMEASRWITLEELPPDKMPRAI